MARGGAYRTREKGVRVRPVVRDRYPPPPTHPDPDLGLEEDAFHGGGGLELMEEVDDTGTVLQLLLQRPRHRAGPEQLGVVPTGPGRRPPGTRLAIGHTTPHTGERRPPPRRE